ncbi:MAG: hypothetical protein P8Y23_08490, partial [Candidatus Lokiarchaeota archaeon]
MSSSENNSESKKKQPHYSIAEPHDLLPRSKWLRDYYFKGVEREWANEFMSFTTGTERDTIWEESSYYIAPKVHT